MQHSFRRNSSDCGCFISCNEGEDVFVHHTQVKEKSHNKDLHEGEAVTFDTIENEKGLLAINVQKF